MEPWLDSLSEDWKSEHRSSSPAPSFASSQQNGSVALSRSQSRIPHLANNIRKDSTTGSFLRHRSTHGKARQSSHSILRERSASSLNLPAAAGSQKYSSLPRRTSNTFSESQNSVQHHSVRETSTVETPEWKRRLVAGEDIHSDGFDLFSPSKLEGVFKHPNSSQLHSDTAEVDDTRSIRKSFNLPASTPFPEQYSSYRTTRSRANLEVLQEVNEEDEIEHQNLSAVSSDLVKNGSIRGLVKQRVQSFERVDEDQSGRSSPRGDDLDHETSNYSVHDPRWRSISGQEELRNEFISPVTVSKQNSIRDTVLKNSSSVNVQELQRRLKQAAIEDEQRPSSSASDSQIHYATTQATGRPVNDEPLPDITSQSLPDDLSMGTQEFVSHGGFINSRRGGRSNEASFLRKSLSFSQEPSYLDSRAEIQINSSPPVHSRHFDHDIEQSKISISAPATPQDNSVVHHTADEIRPASSGSPLKLFGNRDTYTNNKLMRILSQFEEPDSSIGPVQEDQAPEEAQEVPLQMSQFGQGELDTFDFEQNVRRPSPVERAVVNAEDRIFKALDVDPPSTDTQLVIPEQSAAAKENPKAQISATDEKDRTTKRRKTILKDQISIQDHQLELKVSEIEEPSTLAGKKRKDARPGDEGVQANADVLASRDLLKPKSSRKSSVSRTLSEKGPTESNVTQQTPASEDLTEALAAELATFAQEAAQVNTDSRKASLATKDYMEEANKVMQFIRSRGKPNAVVAIPETSEPADISEVNPDSILDLDLDAESTKDSFSRPPSREHTPRPAIDRRHVRHDSRTASYLRKYRDEDDMDVLGGTSVFGTGSHVNNNVASIVAEEEIAEEQESSPANIRILNPNEAMRKRKYSSSSAGQGSIRIHQPPTHSSVHNSTQNSFPTHSSSSGQKGVISSGTVSIPDRVGTMTFDHEKQVWVKKSQKGSPTAKARHDRQTLTEDDPFDSIPDLSIDEQQEQAAKNRHIKTGVVQNESLPNTATQPTKEALQAPRIDVVNQIDEQISEAEDDTEEIDRSSLRSKVSEHEVKLHNGIASKPPGGLKDDRKQARVVTIAFSSPVVSGVNYAHLSEEDFSDLPREEDLPLDDSEIHLDDIDDERVPKRKPVTEPVSLRSKQASLPVIDQSQAVTFQPRTISPIVEDEEDHFDPQMSLVHVEHSKVMTPAPIKSVARLQGTGQKASSILCLTPLSDFSIHQIDKVRDPDQSYVEERKRPNTLRQAHGSLALAVDELVKAITDAAPDELFWDQLQRLSLAPNSVSSVHSLKEYCPVLEQLAMSENRISQLEGLPSTLRILDMHSSMINDLTSWGHLCNLQYLDVSGSQLESLEGFSSLLHLRSLKANNNRITKIDGILDLDALLELELSGNDITNADFEGCELTRLKRLDLSHNQLEDIKNLQFLPVLEDLDVSHNALQTFESFSEDDRIPLQKLQIAHNKLEVIGLKHMPELQHLNLDGNLIEVIQGLSTAYHLEFLSVREQKKQSNIVELILTTPNECRHVRLSSNSVINGTFRLPAMPQNDLRELEIAACGLSELPERFGLYFPNCRVLNANFNAIKEVAPLRKMVHLRTLLLAKNRIQRLRRTCLVMSRLPSLTQIDLRDNPLTVGFYSPASPPTANMKCLREARYHLPKGSETEDAAWVNVLDEITSLKRRTIELLLAEHCKELVQLDGLDLRRKQLKSQDQTWDKLTSKGVLMKPIPEATSQGDNENKTNDGGFVQSPRTTTENDGDVFNA